MINNYFKMFFITIYLVLNTQPVFAKKFSTSIYGGIANNRKIGKYTSDYYKLGYSFGLNFIRHPEKRAWSSLCGSG